MNIINQIINKIEENNKIALFQHINPDGDSISSSYGLALALKEVYPKKEIVVVSDFNYLQKHFSFLDFDKSLFQESINDEYLAIVGDTSQSERVLKYDQLIKAKEIICFDHHKGETNLNLSIYWHEPTYPASALQASEIAFMLKNKFNEKTAISLLFGILTDTGFFKYSLTNPKPLKITNMLFNSISDSALNKVYIDMSRRTKKDIEIQSMILNKIQYHENITYIIFERDDIEKYGKEEIKSKLYLISNIDKCNIWMFVMRDKEVNGGKGYKVSLRSSKFDINEVAKKWNGGGHQRAAGCFLQTKEDVPFLLKDLKKSNPVF